MRAQMPKPRAYKITLPFAIVFAEPIHKIAYADFNGSHWSVSGILLQFADVGEGIGDVSRLHRQHNLFGLATQKILEHFDVAQ